MRRIVSVAGAVAALSLSGCVISGGGVSPYGRLTTVHPTAGLRVSGELIAVSDDSVWVLSDGILSAYRLDSLRRVDVRRHQFGAKKTFRWMAVAGAATGAALMIACMSYEGGDGGCALLPPAMTGVFLVPGSLFALLNYDSAWQFLGSRDAARMRPYARFPQGLPDTLRIARPILAPQGR